jgi:CubicO group peptidase (beta-lactamase class C family)
VVDLFTTEKVTIGESVKRLAKLPLHHHPGEKYTYSEGLDVLGYLIEVVSRNTLRRLSEEAALRSARNWSTPGSICRRRRPGDGDGPEARPGEVGPLSG